MCLLLAFLASELKGLCQDEEATDTEYAEIRDRLHVGAQEFLEWRVACPKIADRYFAGVDPLFPGYATQLAGALMNLDQVVTLFNQQLDWRTWRCNECKGAKKRTTSKASPEPSPVAPIDLDGLKQALIPAGLDLAQHIVVMAKAEAADFMGERREALALVRARLWPERD
jgi:hypothetical protein